MNTELVQPAPTDISKMDLKDLKALAYDMINKIETSQRILQAANNQILQKERAAQMAKLATAPKEPEKKEGK